MLGIIIFDRNYWYIKYIIFCYIIFYFIFRYIKGNKERSISLIIVSFIVLFLPSMGNGRMNIFGFAIGVILSLYKDRIMKLYNNSSRVNAIFALSLISASYALYKILILTRTQQAIEISLIIIILAIIYFSVKRKEFVNGASLIVVVNYFTAYDYNVNFIFSLSVLCAGIGFIVIVDLIKHDYASKFFVFFGNISFELYLVHGALMYSYDFILFRLPIELSFFIYIIVIITISFIFNKLFNFLNNILKN